MLSYFRINDPYRLVGLLVLTVLIFITFLVDLPPLTAPELKSIVLGEKLANGFSLYTDVIDFTPPFTGWLHKITFLLFGKAILGRHILALLIIFIQAAYLGFIFIDKKVFPENSFLPSVLVVILYAFSFDTLFLSGELFASIFILLALNNLFKEVEFREESMTLVLKIGFYIGLASLFSFSFAFYVPGTLIILLMFTRSSGRKFMLLVLGFLIPHLLVIASYYISDTSAKLWQFYYIPNLSLHSSAFLNFTAFYHLLIVAFIYTVISIVILNRESRFTKYQSQLLQVMFFWLIFSVLQVSFSKELRPQTLISIIPPVAFFISHYLLMIRRKRIAEIAFFLFLAVTVAVSYYNRYSELDNEDYQRFVVKTPGSPSGKKIVVLADDLNAYYGNSLGSSFLNWKLAQDIFEHPEYYENVVQVYEGIHNDPPSLIIDPKGVMKPFMQKIPEFKNEYTLSGQTYSLKKPN